jgi:hypothetical protein
MFWRQPQPHLPITKPTGIFSKQPEHLCSSLALNEVRVTFPKLLSPEMPSWSLPGQLGCKIFRRRPKSFWDRYICGARIILERSTTFSMLSLSLAKAFTDHTKH